MKRNVKNCRHSKAFPTTFRDSIMGFCWCPDCGAYRLIIKKHSQNNSYEYAEDRWIYPTGIDDVLDQLDKV